MGKPVETLIDTGATSSAISKECLFRFSKHEKFINRRDPKTCVSVNNQTLKSLYTVVLPIELQPGSVISHEFEVIPNLISQALLGTDFLKRHNVKLDFSINELQIYDRKFIFDNVHTVPDNILSASDDCLLEPESITLVRAEFPEGNTDYKTHAPVLIGPLSTSHGFSSYSVVCPDADEIVVEMINLSSTPVHIAQGSPIAAIEAINPEISDTGIKRDLLSMPSEFSHTNITDAQTDLHIEMNELFNEQNTDPHTSDNDIMQAEESRGCLAQDAYATINTANETPLNDDTNISEIDRRGGLAQDASATIHNPNVSEFIPRGVLTRDGVKYFSEEWIASVDDLNKNIEHEHKLRTDNTILSTEDVLRLQQIIDKYPNVVAKNQEDLGLTTLTYHYANLTSDVPVRAPAFRTPPPRVREQINIETNRLLAAGVIGESESPYSTPIVLVKKPNGTYRYCTDFRALNKLTKKVNFPLPHITDSIRRLKDPKIFSSLDLLKGYFQIPVAEAHRKYFGFSDGTRQLEYLRCPMGSVNSGSTMASLMERVFRGFPPEYFLSYLDDIIISSPCVETHLEMLDKTLAALQRAGLKLNPLKCKLAQASVTTLGFILSGDGIKPDPKNLKKIEDWPVPKNVKHVRSFLGLTSYYRGHIVNFAEIAAPLTNLLCKNEEWNWTDEHQQSYNSLKEKLLSGTACCHFPDFDKTFILKADGCGESVGGVLSQKDDRNKEVMIAAASQKLNSDQKKWCSFDVEFFALVWAVRQFQQYLRFKKFVIVTDNKPLLSAININCKNDGSGKRVRWSLELQSYDFDIVYKKGIKHLDADALSRCPHADPPQDDSDDQDVLFVGAVDTFESGLAEIVYDKSESIKLRNEQQTDDFCKSVMTKLRTEKENDIQFVGGRQYAIVEGMLYLISIDKRTKDKLARVVVPESLKAHFLDKAHGDVFSGHPGEKRLYDKLRRYAYWPGMKRDSGTKAKTCLDCQAFRSHSLKQMVPVIPQKSDFPMQYVVADLLKIYPPSRGMNYILIFEDRFSKYTVMYAIPDKTTLTVAKRFTNFITRFGCPITWATDNGGEFRSNIIEALCKAYGTKKTFGLAYHPPSQGGVERKNRTVISELSKRVNQFGSNWADHISWIEFGINTVPHTSTGFTPYRLMFGRDPKTPFCSAFPHVDMSSWDRESKQYFSDIQNQVEQAQIIARQNHEKYRNSMVAQTSKKGIQAPYAVGSKVWKFLPREQRSKISVNYDGPWTVTNVIGNTFKIEKDGKEEHRPQSDLKPYEEPAFGNNNIEKKSSDTTDIDDVGDARKYLLPGALFLFGNFANASETAEINAPPPSPTNQQPLSDDAEARSEVADADAVDRTREENVEGILDVTPPFGFDLSFDSDDERTDERVSGIPVLAPRRASMDAADLTERQKRELKKLDMPGLRQAIKRLPEKRKPSKRKLL